jgi:hypothetical protein
MRQRIELEGGRVGGCVFPSGATRLGSSLATGCTVHEIWLDVKFALSGVF